MYLERALKARLAASTPRAIDRLAEALDGDDAKLAITAAWRYSTDRWIRLREAVSHPRQALVIGG